jgi:cell wall-associated NlpC family hydrolase
VTLAVTAGMVLSVGSAAHASPVTPTDNTSAADLENQINQKWNALEPTIENYDAVSEKLAAKQAQADKLQAKIEPLALQVTTAQARIGAMAAQLYEAGPNNVLNALLASDKDTDLLNLLGTVEQMAINRQAQLAATTKLVDQYKAQKKPIDALIASLAQQRAALAATKNKINAQITQLDALRIKLWGSTQEPGSTRPVACPQKYNGDPGSRAAAAACSKIGKRYVWGSGGPNTFDCSGLTMWSWAQVGVSLPHNAYQQKHSMPSVKGYASLRPGDLIFYYSGISH